MQRFRSNAVFKEFDVGDQFASGGPGLLWRLHSATSKSTSQSATVFLFDKKALSADKSLSKLKKETLLNILKNDASQLQKLRHPYVVHVIFPLSESGGWLGFATEPVVASLSNLLGRTDHVPKFPLRLRDYDLTELEKALGLMDVAEALHFLHDSAKMVHGNVTPDSIYVTEGGGWKLGGFSFSMHMRYNDQEHGLEFPEYEDAAAQLAVIRALQPDLNYLAPEYILNKTCNAASDIFSLCATVYAMFNRGQPLLDAHGSVLTFQHNVEKISRMTAADLQNVPPGLLDIVKRGLATHPSVRPSAQEIPRSDYFKTLSILTCRFLASIYEKDDVNKAQFMKNLPQVLKNIPKRVQIERILPVLITESKTSAMQPFVLPSLLVVGDECSMVEFERLILPHLRPMMTVTDPPHLLQVFLNKMELLLKKCPEKDLGEHVLPMLYRAIESDSANIQQLALAVLPEFMHAVEFSALKNDIIPRVQALCVAGQTTNVTINALVCLGKMLSVMDKWLVHEMVLPMLPHVKRRDAGVLMALLGIIHTCLKERSKYGFDKTIITNKILPLVIPLSVEPALNRQQFGRFMKLIRDSLGQVEEEHSKYLKDKESMQRETDSIIPSQDTSKTAAPSDDELLMRMQSQLGASSSAQAGQASQSDTADLLASLLDDSFPGLSSAKSPGPLQGGNRSGAAVSALPTSLSTTASSQQHSGHQPTSVGVSASATSTATTTKSKPVNDDFVLSLLGSTTSTSSTDASKLSSRNDSGNPFDDNPFASPPAPNISSAGAPALSASSSSNFDAFSSWPSATQHQPAAAPPVSATMDQMPSTSQPGGFGMPSVVSSSYMSTPPTTSSTMGLSPFVGNSSSSNSAMPLSQAPTAFSAMAPFGASTLSSSQAASGSTKPTAGKAAWSEFDDLLS